MKPILFALIVAVLLAMSLLNPLVSVQGQQKGPNPTEIKQTAQAPTMLAATVIAQTGLEPIPFR